MYKILFLKSDYKNLYGIINDTCELAQDKETYLTTSSGKHIKLKTNKLINIKDNIYGIFDNKSLFILERL